LREQIATQRLPAGKAFVASLQARESFAPG
jgi:hypothetical protein